MLTVFSGHAFAGRCEKRVHLRFLAGHGILGLFGVEGFVLNPSTNLQAFQACYAEVVLHIRNNAARFPHSDC